MVVHYEDNCCEGDGAAPEHVAGYYGAEGVLRVGKDASYFGACAGGDDWGYYGEELHGCDALEGVDRVA